MNSARALSGVGTVHAPYALYRHFDKETRTFSASRSRRAKTLAERSQARTTPTHANAMGRRHGETIHHEAGHGSSTILPPNPPASIRAWTSRAAEILPKVKRPATRR